jgi:phosphatidylglycerophosphatase A
MTPNADDVIQASLGKKPSFALAIASCFGLGYLPKAPGIWGSLAGVFLSWILLRLWPHIGFWSSEYTGVRTPFAVPAGAAVLLIAVLGVWASTRVAADAELEDPQFVVIDEVSGQMIALLFGIVTTVRYVDGMSNFYRGFWWHGDVRWTPLLLGFILFRVFDIWKPWPILRLEKLPGGWGIMADNWMAGIYAAILLRLALHFGLV